MRSGKSKWVRYRTYLDHEARNDTMEARSFITKPLLTSAESTEVGSTSGCDIIVKLEHNTRSRAIVYRELKVDVTASLGSRVCGVAAIVCAGSGCGRRGCVIGGGRAVASASASSTVTGASGGSDRSAVIGAGTCLGSTGGRG